MIKIHATSILDKTKHKNESLKLKTMNEQIFKGKWNQLKGEVQKEWGKLTNNDVDQIEGELTRLKGTIQVKYGQSKEE